ncbi:MAG: thermonuclease family protein [Chthoniobacterales bacterium]
MKYIFVCLCFFSFCSAYAEWEVLEDCYLSTYKFNDGDSFHVRYNGKKYIFRLCYVDTPETNDRYPDRTSEQAEYWDISKEELFLVAKYSKKRVAELLREPFTIRTKWTKALGSSRLQRHYALIETGEGDLGEILVKEGLVRIHGYKPKHPDGKSGKAYMKYLHELEAEAKEKKVGAWIGRGDITQATLNGSKKHNSQTPFKSYAERIRETLR